jgi:hypothetical protein
MNKSTKPTENLAECGNKSKPLLANRYFKDFKYTLKAKRENSTESDFGSKKDHSQIGKKIQ